jgi:TonB family protein
VPNAVVTLNCEAPQLNSEGRTGPDGQFTASGFVAGTYKVSVSKPGFKSARITMPIEPRQKAAPRVVLGLGAMREMIVVAAVTAASDVTSLPPSGPLIRSTTDAPVNDPCATSQEGGCVMAPRKLVDVKPIYPQSYAATGGTGTVVINARILTDGTAGDLKPQPGSDAVLSAAAMDAIRRWRFSPTHLDGVPVPVDMIVTVRFEISR